MTAKLARYAQKLFSQLQFSWIIFGTLLGIMSLLPFFLIHSEMFCVSLRPWPNQSYRPPLVRRIVFVMVDGLGYASYNEHGWMPLLKKREPYSAHGIALASFPTLTPSGIRSLFAGHPSVPRFVFPGGMKPHHEYDSVFARAASAGRNVFVVGQQDWPRIYSGHGAVIRTVSYQGPSKSYDESVLEEGFQILDGKSGPWDLLVLHLFDLDCVGHTFGVGSPPYLQKLLSVDKAIQQLASRLGPDDCIVVTADHGQTKNGGHGGSESIVRRVPFVLWGKSIRPEFLGEFAQYDAAPTLCALMGIPPPALSEGWPLLNAIQLSPEERSAILQDLLEQRMRLWLNLRTNYIWLENKPLLESEKSRRSYYLKMYGPANEYAENTIHEIDDTILNASPRQWLGKLVLALWILILAGCLSLGKKSDSARAKTVGLLLGITCVTVMMSSLYMLGRWELTADFIIFSVSILLYLSALPWIQDNSTGFFHRMLLWLGLSALSFPNLFHVKLWSCLLVLLVGCFQYYRLQNSERSLTAWGLVAMAASILLTSWRQARGISWIHEFLRNFTFIGCWNLIEFTIMASMIAVFIKFRRQLQEQASFYLSLAALAFYGTVSSRPEFCFLGSMVLASWGLGLSRKSSLSVLDGLGVIGMSLWAYRGAGGNLDFSHISIREGYGELGHAWHPHWVVFSIVLKHIAIIGASVLPLLAELPFNNFSSFILPLGSISTGALLLLWSDYYMFQTIIGRLLDDMYFERLIFGILLTWTVLSLWIISQGLRRKQPVAAPA